MRIFGLFLFSLVFFLGTGLAKRPSYKNNNRYKVYDCFPFFNELDRLEIRLHELDPVVDYFVLVEATQTFQGGEKPLYFQENKERYKKFLDKIIHVVVDFSEVRKSGSCDDASDIYKYQEYQRNYILQVLKQRKCKSEDVVFVSDLDEIPRASSIKKAIKILRSKRKRINIVKMELDWYEIFYNSRVQIHKNEVVEDGFWIRPFGALWSYLRSPGVDLNLIHGNRRESPKDEVLLKNAGWHFTWAGGAKKLAQKVHSISGGAQHVLDKNKYTTEEFWQQLIKEKKSFGGDRSLKIVSVDESFPVYIRNNLDYFIKNGLVAFWD
jgi:beta-1,4-mannosyl-glycoprotein beta-1,4-N-acetylglucosaminyltransferase